MYVSITYSPIFNLKNNIKYLLEQHHTEVITDTAAVSTAMVATIESEETTTGTRTECTARLEPTPAVTPSLTSSDPPMGNLDNGV